MKLLDDGRWRLACVLARRDGLELPASGANPASSTPSTAPPSRTSPGPRPAAPSARSSVCRRRRAPVTSGEDPEIRLVRVGDRYVPWYAEGKYERGLLTGTSWAPAAVNGVPSTSCSRPTSGEPPATALGGNRR